MDNRGISKEIFKKLHLDEIVEIHKDDLFMLLETAHQFMLHIGMSEDSVAKVLAVICIKNKWGDRVVEEFTEFVMAMGGDYEQEKIKLN